MLIPMSKTITDALVWSSAGSSSSLWGKGDIREWAFLPGSDRLSRSARSDMKPGRMECWLIICWIS
ncbi:MAG: hypothetical protein IPI90_15995 [Saprospiraceae bacterium]|nr:hypothetical protein [Candidatus Vicinibacter affinis]